MRNLKKFLALVLAMMMAFSLMVTANAKNVNAKKVYNDLEGTTFEDAIDVLTGMGVFKGNDGNFGPERPITRAEAVAVLYRLVTGDVTDSQRDLYIPAANFTDVSPNAWYAGYVGFAVDAGLVKGWNKTFMPTNYVTGYEMLAMLLRAVGYGKNEGEFTGNNWMVNVGARAQSLGILKSIESTHYKNTLGMPSAREVVAELTFETATKVRKVNWTSLGGYSEYDQLLGGTKNPTLGEDVFGLTETTGIVVGNQETGEGKTLLGTNGAGTAGHYTYTEDKDNDVYVLKFDTKTTLAFYGHKVTVWSDGKGHGYAVLDDAKSDTIYTNKTTAADIAKAAGMKDAEGTVQCSDKYSTFTADTLVTSPVKMYTVIDNDGNGKADVIISLNAEVAKVTETKTTAKPQTINLGDVGTSAFTNGTLGTLTVSGDNNQVIGEFDIKTALGKIFTVWDVTGTKALSDGNTYAVLDPKLNTVTGTVSTYKMSGGKIASVNAVIDGKTETIERSGILEGSQAIAYYADNGPSLISAGVTYTFTLDAAGRFVNISSPNEYSFLYTTYADFQYGAMGTGDIEYKVYGFGWDGQPINNHDITSMTITDPVDPDATKDYPNSTETLGDGYNRALHTTKKNMANNSVVPGYNKGFMINNDGDIREGGDGVKLALGSSWPITNTDAANGFVKVSDTNNNDYMLTNDTKFYVVTGFGVNASVKVYNGLKELIGTGTSVQISYLNASDDEVWFLLDDHKFDSINTDENKTITTVILADTNLRSYDSKNLYFVEKGTVETGVKMASSGAKQYQLWLNGVKGTYWLTSAAGTTLENANSTNNFVTLSQKETKNGVPIYEVEVLNTNSTPKDDLPGNGGSCYANANSDNLKYEYVMVNNYSKGQLTFVTEGKSVIMNVAGAAVADVQFNADGADISDRIEINTLQKLNNAVSTDYQIQVAIVNNGIDVSTIYVLGDGVNPAVGSGS